MQAALRAGRICTRRLSSASSQKQALAAQRYNQAVVDGIVKEKPVVLVNKTLIEHYATLLHERPLLTNATTSGVLCAVGDVLAQLIEWRASSSRTILEDSWEESNRAPRAPASLDAARTGRMAIYGFFICGPLLTGWYKGLNAISEALSVSYRVMCPTPCPLKFAIVTSTHPRESHHNIHISRSTHSSHSPRSAGCPFPGIERRLGPVLPSFWPPRSSPTPSSFRRPLCVLAGLDPATS